MTSSVARRTWRLMNSAAAPHEHRRLDAGLQEPRPADPLGGAVRLEHPMRARAARVHHPLGDSLMVEVADLLPQVMVLQQRRSTAPHPQRVIAVRQPGAVRRGQERALLAHALRWLTGIYTRRRQGVGSTLVVLQRQRTCRRSGLLIRRRFTGRNAGHRRLALAFRCHRSLRVEAKVPACSARLCPPAPTLDPPESRPAAGPPTDASTPRTPTNPAATNGRADSTVRHQACDHAGLIDVDMTPTINHSRQTVRSSLADAAREGIGPTLAEVPRPVPLTDRLADTFGELLLDVR